MLFLGGIIVLLGAFIPKIRQYSFVVSSVIFSRIVLGRLISFGIEGIPSSGVIRAMIGELILGVLNLYCLKLSKKDLSEI